MNNEQNAAMKPANDEPSKSMKIVRELYDWIEIFVITVSAILLIFTFFIRIAFVDGESMLDTLHHKETLAVSNLFYTPKRGDIVVFQAPDSPIEGGVVKRVIATEGQTVDIDFENWKVYVDGKALDEPYIKPMMEQWFAEHQANTSYTDNWMSGWVMELRYPITVPEGHIFVMGDNRNNSRDSRDISVGCIDERYVFGKVLFRVTPFDKFGAID